jgi:hypothetical protein
MSCVSRTKDILNQQNNNKQVKEEDLVTHPYYVYFLSVCVTLVSLSLNLQKVLQEVLAIYVSIYILMFRAISYIVIHVS